MLIITSSLLLILWIYLEFKKVILYVSKVYRLIELVAYQYQEVASTVLEAIMEGMDKLSVLRMEQCEDGWPTEKWGPQVCNLTWEWSETHKYLIWHENIVIIY
jgi:hypothetical protein